VLQTVSLKADEAEKAEIMLVGNEKYSTDRISRGYILYDFVLVI
jgi:hypothetical protein